MKPTRLTKLYALLLLVIFGGIVVHAPLSVFVGVHVPALAEVIKAWKEIVMVIAALIAILLVSRAKLWRQLWREWPIRLAVIYAALHVVLLAWQSQGFLSTAAGLMIDLRYVLYFVLVYVLIRLAPEYRRTMLIVGAIGAVVVVGFGTLQFFLPSDILSHIGYSKATIAPYLTVDENPDYIRINSTLRGPNPLGAYAVITLSVLAALLGRGVLQLQKRKVLVTTIVFAVCSVVVLWISYSRGALIGALVALVVIALLTIARRLSWQVWLGVGVVVIALAGGLVAFRGNSVVSNVILHENEGTGADVSSNEGHLSSLESGFGKVARAPLGNGIGSTGSASLYGEDPEIIENQYLFIAHETGWIGFGLFIALYVAIPYSLWVRRTDYLALGVFASGIGLAVIGFVLPVWADDTVSIVWWGLAGVALGMHNRSNHGRQRSTHQKATRTA